MSTGEGNGPRERALAKGFFHVIFVLQRRATTRLISISRSRESRRFVATLVPDRAGNRRATNRGPLGCIIVGFGFYFTLIMCFFSFISLAIFLKSFGSFKIFLKLEPGGFFIRVLVYFLISLNSIFSYVRIFYLVFFFISFVFYLIIYESKIFCKFLTTQSIINFV